MKLKMVIIRPGIWGLTKKDLRDAGRDAMYAPMLLWHAQFKKHHFQLYAFGKYGIPHPTHGYAERKDREHPEAEGRPNVFSGQSEQLAMASNQVRVKAQSFERFTGEAVIDGPNLNFHPERMTVLAANELVAMQAAFAEGYKKNFLAAAERRMQPVNLAVA